MRTDFLDFPTAWDIQHEVGPSLPHDELCSAMYSIAFLCDCGAIPNEWERRRQLLDAEPPTPADSYPQGAPS